MADYPERATQTPTPPDAMLWSERGGEILACALELVLATEAFAWWDANGAPERAAVVSLWRERHRRTNTVVDTEGGRDLHLRKRGTMEVGT